MWLASSGTVIQSPWWPKEGAPGMSIVWVMWPSCFSWVLIAVGLSMHGVESSWVTMTLKPDHSVWATMFVYVEWVWPHEVEFSPTSSGICWDFSLGMQLVELIGLFFLCSLDPTNRCFGSGTSGWEVQCYEGLWCRSMSSNTLYGLWDTCFELQRDP